MAKIISLKKPKKADFTESSAFRPISFLCTLSKAMELVIVDKIAYFAKKFCFFPSNHYEAFKQKSTIDALLTMQEKIYQAWKYKKVLSLVTFDLKGAFNNVPANVLAYTLQAY